MLPELSGLSLTLFAGVCGLLIGSFLNVCIYRIPRDLSVVTPRSFCPNCGDAIPSWANIPIFSFLWLGGRCRKCRTGISLRYPIVEATTAVLFGLVARRYGFSLAALKWMIFEALLVILFWTDLETEILPDEITLGGSAVAVLSALVVPVPGVIGDLTFEWSRPVLSSLTNSLSGAVLLSFPIWLVGAVFSKLVKKEALGFGDVKLLACLGGFLGFESGLQALLAGTVGGAVVGIVWMAFYRKKPLSMTLRFGSFLCAAAAFIPLLNKIGSV